MKTVCTLLFSMWLAATVQAHCTSTHPCISSYSQTISPTGTSTTSKRNSGQSSGTSDGPPISPAPSRIVVIPQGGTMWPNNDFPDLPPQPPDYKKLLDKNGPQFAKVFSMSSFSVLGYAKGGWPMVIDYQQQQESFALITVSVDGVDPFYYHLRASDRAGHFQEVVHLPQRFGDKPVIAHYSVQALSMNAGEVSPTNFLILGLGAGDKAVASVGIDRVDFGPKAIHLPQNEKASYTFHSEFDFPEVEAGVLKVGLLKGQIMAARVSENHIKNGIRQNSEISKDWDGKRSGKPCTGQHLLQVRAWRSSQDGGDWVAAWSPQVVEVLP
jgi:hypothetical protein